MQNYCNLNNLPSKNIVTPENIAAKVKLITSFAYFLIKFDILNCIYENFCKSESIFALVKLILKLNS